MNSQSTAQDGGMIFLDSPPEVNNLHPKQSLYPAMHQHIPAHSNLNESFLQVVVFIKVIDDNNNELVKKVFLDTTDSSLMTSSLVKVSHPVNIENEEKIFISVLLLLDNYIAGSAKSFVH